MESPTSSHEILICQTCGDKGFTNAFVYCVKCLGFVIHRYCLKVIPNSFDEIVNWACEDCDTSHKVKPSLTQNQNPTSPPNPKTTTRKKKPKKKPKMKLLVEEKDEVICLDDIQDSPSDSPIKDASVKSDFRLDDIQDSPSDSPIKDASVKSDFRLDDIQDSPSDSPIKDASVKSDFRLDDIQDSPSDSPIKDASVKSDFRNNYVLALEVPTKGENKRKRDESYSGVKIKKNGTRIMADSNEHSYCDSSCSDVILKNKEGVQQSEMTSADKSGLFQKDSTNQTPPNDHNAQAETANQMHNEEEIRACKNGADATQSTFIENNTENIPYQPANPVLDPVWRGSFDITETDYNLLEGLVGHLSDKAHPKVFEEANVLPSLLSLEMHPKAALWPKSFSESQPSDENIALYFFPGDSKNERDYEELVIDMIDEDLAMRAPSKNADLLLFTSRVLPRPFWRFQGKNYLWGVFRGKKNESSSPVTSGKETITKLKTFDSQSPQSPLCNYS